MALPSMEDILRHRFSGTNRNYPHFPAPVKMLPGKSANSLHQISSPNTTWWEKSLRRFQGFSADIQTSFSALFDRSLLDSPEFLHSPSSSRWQNVRPSRPKVQQRHKKKTKEPTQNILTRMRKRHQIEKSWRFDSPNFQRNCHEKTSL